MARANTKRWALSSPNKKTTIGDGTYSKKPHAGGETFYGQRAGSTPSKSRRRKKPYKGQGR
jgi:hypothetical protein